MGTLKRAFFIKDRLKLDSRDICPYIIYTGPRFHKKKGYYVSFCNNEHDDNDVTYGAIGLVVKQYLDKIKCPLLVRYFQNIWVLFPDKCKDCRVPLPSTCIWNLLQQLMGNGRGIRHLQYLVLTEAGVAWNLSF